MLTKNQLLTINRVTSAKQIAPLASLHPEDAPFRPSILSQKSNRQNSRSPNGMSPNKLNSAKFPQVLRRQKNSSTTILPPSHNITPKVECHNHPKRAVEFRTFINGQVKFYCERCATQLASQGLKVQKLEADYSTKKYVTMQTKNYEGFPRAMEITEFLESLKIAEKSLKENTKIFSRMQDHYRAKLEELEDFYCEMTNYINMIKTEHMRLLKAEARKYVQIALIQCGSNEQNLSQINCIVFDIESQMEAIVKVISDEQFKKCLREYTKNLQFYTHASEQQQNFVKQVTEISQDNLSMKLSDFKTFIHRLLGAGQSKKETGATFSFEKSGENQPPIINPAGRPSHEQVKPSAFRNLFEDSDNNPGQSPMFKLI